MSSIALILAYVGCLSSGSMLSMLLLLVAAYISASIWLIVHGVYYSGLLYILVYVGAIVVLIIFVVQLTNTSLESDKTSRASSLLSLINVLILLASLSILSIMAINSIGLEVLFNLSSINTTTNLVTSTYTQEFSTNLSTLNMLAESIFNEYGYILVISVHAIILAVIGPIKLALDN